MAPPRGSPKPPGSGRKKGSKNKLSTRNVKQLAEELVQDKLAAQQQQLDETTSHPLTPLQYCLEAMRDESNPPGFRLECAKATLPYMHAKVAEAPSDKPVEIHTIERVIIHAKRQSDDVAPLEEIHRIEVEPGAVPAAPPERPADPLLVARSRLDRLKGVN
jgi:hypothetical protein